MKDGKITFLSPSNLSREKKEDRRDNVSLPQDPKREGKRDREEDRIQITTKYIASRQKSMRDRGYSQEGDETVRRGRGR